MAFLGSLLLNDAGRNAEFCAKCKPDYFYREAHRRIFRAMQKLSSEGGAIDTVLLRDALIEAGCLEECGGLIYLIQLAEYVPTSANADHYLSVILDKHERRQIVETASMLGAVAMDESASIEEAKNAASALLVSMGSGSAGSCFQASEIISEMWDRIDERVKNGGGLAGISWGIPTLDFYTSGLEESKLYIVGGRPAMGKTGLLTSVASSVCLREGAGATVIFSLEMSRGQIMERMICSRARVNSKRLKEGRLSKDELDRIHEASEAYWASGLVIDDAPDPSASYIISTAMQLAVKHGSIDAIFIDYLGLIQSSEKKDPRIAISDNAKAMKALARKMRCPVILLAQLNRGVEHRDNKRPTMADLAESGTIEAAADVVVFPFRPQYYEFGNASRNFEQPEEAELIVAKCRDGATGTASAGFIPAYTLFQPHRRD